MYVWVYGWVGVWVCEWVYMCVCVGWGVCGYHRCTRLHLRINTRRHWLYPVEDVREVLAFARTHGMQPTVKSTGHDYVGRSAGNGTLSIDLSRMRHIAIDVFDKRSDTGASLATGPGNMWKDLYRAVGQQIRIIYERIIYNIWSIEPMCLVYVAYIWGIKPVVCSVYLEYRTSVFGM